jgi:ABC-2 type transport system permease protein
MIREFFKFEMREQLRSPLLWLLSVLFGLLAFAALSSDAVQIGGGIGNVHRNAPTVIAQFFGVFTLLGMLIVASLFSNAMLRDFDLGTADLIFSNPIKKRDYLVGRFSAAFIASLFVYLVIGTFMFAAQFMPWIEAERLGAISITPFIWAVLVFVLPNAFFSASLLTFFAVTTRSILWVYIGVLAFLVLYFVSGAMLADLDNVWLATLVEPMGLRAFGRTVRYWSTEERNSGLPAFAGYIMANRALWIGISLFMVAAAFKLFKTERAGTGKAWRKKKISIATEQITTLQLSAPTKITPKFSSVTVIAQYISMFRFDLLGVFRSIPFLVMLAFGMVNFIPSALLAQTLYETPIYPVTSQMISALNGSFNWLLVIIALFYAGELVWKERGAKLGELTDAMPVPNWVPILAKFSVLVAIIIAFQLMGSITAILIQLGKGYTAIEPLLYVKAIFIQSIFFILMGGLSLALQVYTNNKFVGYGLLILVLIAQITLGFLDFTHNLYQYAGAPNAPYSDMNGYGHFLKVQWIFQAYWVVFLAILMIFAALFWVRGVAPTFRERMHIARQRLTGKPALALTVCILAFVGIGGYIYWNTNILNRYLSPDRQLDLQAKYEKDYKKLKDLPQPRIVAADINVDLRPETQTAVVNGQYRLHNPHANAINEIYITTLNDDRLSKLEISGATLAKHDKDSGFRTYRLSQPMGPGSDAQLVFSMNIGRRGFENGGQQSQIVENGSFFNNRLFPAIGYNDNYEISDRNERRKRNMGEPQRMPKLEDEAARANTYIGSNSDWIDYQTTICTAADQIALAPGYLQKEFSKNGRRCFSYAMDRPMLNFYAYLSARWKVKKGMYKNIPIEVYYDPKHPYNTDRMIEAVQKSLSYYETNFSPYQHKQARIIEFPGFYSSDGFAQAFANTIPYSESIGFIADLRKPENIDYVFYVTAHEIAHQWWAHQVIGANTQGATMLSESLSQYSALMVMEKEYGRDKMRKFLKYELDRYLSGRGGEIIEEQPLYRNENQQYIHYRKGSLAFYRLREEMGEAALNRALSKFIAATAFQKAPFTNSKELISYIRAEAKPDQQLLITDLFEKISFYDNRVETASAKKRADGKYDVTLSLHADKLYSDGKGKETPGVLNDWVEIGIFSGKDDKDQKTLYLKRHLVTGKNTKLTVTVDSLPTEAGFDPNNKLIDRVSSDNRKSVSIDG